MTAAEASEEWKCLLDDPQNESKEAERIEGRTHRLVALFGSSNCHSANVYASKHDLGELVNYLIRQDRLPEQNPYEGLQLLTQAWDEHYRHVQRFAVSGTRVSVLVNTGVCPAGFLAFGLLDKVAAVRTLLP